MSSRLNLVTGATGLLGSHLVELLRARGERVRALVRPSSETALLRELGVELVEGDLLDAASLRPAVAGAEVVYHTAARVGDWGPWSLYQTDIIDTTRHLVQACRAEGVSRFIHVSSLAVYGRPRDGVITETAPLGQRLLMWDYYGPAKIAAENIVREHLPDAVILRPGWIYGPRDRVSMPRVVRALRSGRVPMLGSGDNSLNILYASDVAEAALLAADNPCARGQVYNLSSAGEVTQRQLLDTLTDALGLPRVTRRVPVFVAMQAAFVLEAVGRLLRWSEPPRITRKAVALVSRSTRYSTQKARNELGWRPQVSIEDGIRRTLDWFLARDTRPAVAASVK
jgi:nucleoside-diphosphate-sugar epimerase